VRIAGYLCVIALIGTALAADSPLTRPAQPAVRAVKNTVYIETARLPSHKPIRFSLRGIWRYDPDGDRWAKVLKVAVPQAVEIKPTRPGEGNDQLQLVELPEQIGLYWVTWTENDEPFASLAFNGPILCNDVMIGDPPKGKIATCVPFKDHARAQFVPDPKLHCK
jgi:hypothetical protein